MKRLLLALVLSLGCISRPVLEVQPVGCVPTPEGTVYEVTRVVDGDTCKGADIIALAQTLGNTPDCGGFWDPSPDKCTYDVYAQCSFEAYDYRASVQVFTILTWNADWSIGKADQTYTVMNVAHYKSCEGHQNIDLVKK